MLVHGTGSYADIWSPVLDEIARSYRVIAYDRRGFACSSPAPRGGLAEHAVTAAALLNALGASPATVTVATAGSES
ncbi:MAG: alpha/beta fold hydrolase [Solirubrobacteraceae bacterium]